MLDTSPAAAVPSGHGAPVAVTAFTVVNGSIAGIAVVANPAKLALMDLPEPDSTG
jgi:hypothetical protein